MIFDQIRYPSSDNLAYLIADDNTREAMVVDPPLPISPVISAINKRNVTVKYIVNTHGHRDHISGNAELAMATGAKRAAYINARHRKDIALEDGGILMLGNLKVEVIHTPGHSPDCICLLVDKRLLTGDTLFVGECGRTDIPGGDPAQLYESLFGKIIKLEDNTEIYPGHDYGASPSSTLGLEKKTNYTLKPRTLDEFIEFMSEP
ncbi:MBL fold metallo-hydrolase [Candidatus Bathyarchaeota archaeon]|nr:MBL fold metallo-hydrolase [Candidatus Bathyarchaeota archaeon]